MSFGDMLSQIGETLGEWVWRFGRRLSKEDKCLFDCVLWALWFARNQLLFKKVILLQQKIAEIARHHLTDYQAASRRQPTALRRATNDKWIPLEMGVIKINTNATCQDGWGMSIGGVMHNSLGEVCWAFADYIEASILVEVAEANAVKFGMKIAKEKGLRNVMVEMHSQIVFFALHNPKPDISYLGGIVNEILRWCSEF